MRLLQSLHGQCGGTLPTAVDARDLSRGGVVVEAKHVAAQTGAARFRHGERGRHGNGRVRRIRTTPTSQKVQTNAAGQRLTGGDGGVPTEDGGAARGEGQRGGGGRTGVVLVGGAAA